MVVTVSELSSKISFVSPQDKLVKAISVIKSDRARAVGVGSEKEFLGLIDDRCLRDFAHSPETTNAGTVAFMPAIVTSETSAEEVVRLFLDSMNSAVAYSSGNGVVDGIILRNQALRLILDASNVRSATVADYASHADAVVPDFTTIATARNKMRDIGVHHLMLTNPQKEFVGVVSSFDIVTKALPNSAEQLRPAPANKVDVFNSPVSGIASMQAVTIAPGEKLAVAIKKMIDTNVAALAVVGGGKPVSILTVRDALHAVLLSQSEPVQVFGLRNDEKAMQQSIIDMGAAFLGKAGRKMPTDYLAIHVKTVLEGKKRRYMVKGKIFINGKMYTASTPENSSHKGIWEPRTAVKEVLDDLGRVISDHVHSKPRSLERERGEEKRRGE